jgi:zinc transporter 5/7
LPSTEAASNTAATSSATLQPHGTTTQSPASPLIRSPIDSQLTLISGVAVFMLTIMLYLAKFSSMPSLTYSWLIFSLASCITAAASILFSRPSVFFPQRGFSGPKYRPWKTSFYTIAPATAIIVLASLLLGFSSARSASLLVGDLVLLALSSVGCCYDKSKPSPRLRRSSNDANGSGHLAFSPTAFSSATSSSILSPFPISPTFAFASPTPDGRHDHHHHDHDHHHHAPATFRRKSSTAAALLQLIDGEDASPVTKFLMKRCQPGSLMAGILAEKDSRRIAYFTM